MKGVWEAEVSHHHLAPCLSPMKEIIKSSCVTCLLHTWKGASLLPKREEIQKKINKYTLLSFHSLLHLPHTIIVCHDCPFFIKQSIKCSGLNISLGLHFLKKALCHITSLKFVCFSPVNLYFSVQFSDPVKDTKRVKESFSFPCTFIIFPQDQKNNLEPVLASFSFSTYFCKNS